MTSVLPPLPRHAPLTLAMSHDPNRPTIGALIGRPESEGTDQKHLIFFSKTVNTDTGAVPHEMMGAAGPHGLGETSVLPPDPFDPQPQLATAQAVAGVRQLAASAASLGHAVPAATFESAEGVAAFLRSLAPADKVIQTFADGQLATRVVSDPAELKAVNALIDDFITPAA